MRTRQTETAIATNSNPRARTLRSRILDWADGRGQFTMRDVRMAMSFRKANIANIRRVVRLLIEAGIVTVDATEGRAFIMSFATKSERNAVIVAHGWV